MRSLVWFRSDLRAGDNTALHAAARGSDRGVIGVFVLAPGEWRAHDVARIKVDFVLRSVRDLSRSLARLNIPLLVLHGAGSARVPGLLLGVARDHGCDALWFNREHGVDERRRDEAVASAFERAGLAVHVRDDQCVLAPGRVRTGDGRFFSVFTPFRRAWLLALAEEGGVRVVPAPRRQAATGIDSSPIPDSVRGFVPPEPGASARLWPAGERGAGGRLRRFVAAKLDRYKTDRDFPALDATSRLSPYLAVGAISPRRCVSAAIEANDGRAGTGRAGPVAWINELIWREFYIHLMTGFPRVSMNRAFKPGAERIAWRDDDGAFDRWAAGRTGVPMVDAGMRQLLAEGWMHNRVRMIAAMYLAKHLLIDWRRGERHFMRHLIDGVLASNNGGWQWCASTGADAAPYFRIFNPTAQSRRFDPQGTYIRRYVPELRAFRSDAIHEPHGGGGAPSAAEYPRPIVEHALARRRALAAFRRGAGRS